jgi:hypothetical protein
VTQLLGLVGSEDWSGHEQVGALPIQLVGTEFARMDMRVPSPVLEQVAEGEITVTEEDDVEEIVASGDPSGQLLPLGRSQWKRNFHRQDPRWGGNRV